MSTSLDIEQSQQLASQIQAKAKQPFENAAKAARKTAGAVYVQGFLVINRKPLQPLEHAWVEVNEVILDPNLAFLNSQPENLHYFPAQKLSLKRLKAALEEAKEDYPEDDPLPIYGDAPYEYYGDKMLGGKAYQTAFEQAEAQVATLKGS